VKKVRCGKNEEVKRDIDIDVLEKELENILKSENDK
jgi:hypothetical protein